MSTHLEPTPQYHSPNISLQSVSRSLSLQLPKGTAYIADTNIRHIIHVFPKYVTYGPRAPPRLSTYIFFCSSIQIQNSLSQWCHRKNAWFQPIERTGLRPTHRHEHVERILQSHTVSPACWRYLSLSSTMSSGSGGLPPDR